MRLRLAGYNVKVNFVDSIEVETEDEGVVLVEFKNAGLLGLCRIADNELDINKNINEEQKRSTVIHEVIEFANSLYDMELSHQTISTLEAFFHTFLKDNLKTINKLYNKP